MGRFTGILGLLTMLSLAYAFSTNRRDCRSGARLSYFFEDFVRSDQRCSQTQQLSQRFVADFRRQGFNRIADHRHSPLALQQPLNRATDAVFRHHSKHH